MARNKSDKIFQRDKVRQNKRDIDNKKQKKDILISCEDSVSAREYFQIIINDLFDRQCITPKSVVIVPHRGKTHPTGVLETLQEYKDYKDFSNKWIVIDRDEQLQGGGHSLEDFNNAIKYAKKDEIDVAYANDCFELWYLLHFDYIDGSMSRKDIERKLKEKLKIKDIKTKETTKIIFEKLINDQQKAIYNAVELLKNNQDKQNPSTTIHLLVQQLNNLIKG
jgi:hypothetical protein